jgi:hypothetical protein
MKLQTAQRKREKIKMGLQGPFGSGTSFSELQSNKCLCLFKSSGVLNLC